MLLFKHQIIDTILHYIIIFISLILLSYSPPNAILRRSTNAKDGEKTGLLSIW